jgi:hypothetical protein
LIREGWRYVGKLFVAAVLIDSLYELIVFRWIYPGQALIVAIVLALPSLFFHSWISKPDCSAPTSIPSLLTGGHGFNFFGQPR